ncbi:Tetratricopeptide TPR_1 repeat-containing protein [Halothece sp. PCC 7418]|uniref:CHAT domain-containing protein n=1 Tax=Halothece sp. (strain PCC 7418) TaxID=65093 RepID=UPI0002A06808|nr:CHAT domain-containing protein [Halothece sp. PCC 7418]AFZ42842.1 Tetratricopeptide TPR_1 repeat-containing protein [Halothece sp. PCC 7418]
MKKSKLLSYFFIAFITFGMVVYSPVLISNSVVAQTVAPDSLLQDGRTAYEQGRYQDAIAAWQTAETTFRAQKQRGYQALALAYIASAYQKLGQGQQAQQSLQASLRWLNSGSFPPDLIAQVLNIQGNLQLAQGQPQTALETWEETETLYQQLEDKQGIIGTQLNQAQALQSLGLYRQANGRLDEINRQLASQPDSALKVTGLQSLGSTLQVVGNLEESQAVLEKALELAQQLQLGEQISQVRFSLANTMSAGNQTERAVELYQQVINIAASPALQLEARLNLFHLLINSEDFTAASALIPEIQQQIAQLSPSRFAVNMRVNFAESLLQLRQEDPAPMLGEAVQQARNLADSRAESYALGTLGKLYEQNQRYREARQLTRQALMLSQQVSAPEISYQWQWQLGRIHKAQGDLKSAIASYTVAVETLDGLRSDLVALNTNQQYSFQESVEPVYRELVSLLLNPTVETAFGKQRDIPKSLPISQNNLQRARDVIESLQVAELDNYFREACLDVEETSIEEIDSQAAVIYPMILPQELAVILSIPEQPLTYYSIPQSSSQVEATLNQFLQSLNLAFPNEIRREISTHIYDWLIRPALPQLAQHDIQTLVFVLDGFLRNVPMAALSDGEQYLIEQYAIALTPGLQLFPSEQRLANHLNVFTGGLSKPRQGFVALPEVETEISQIMKIFPTEVLLNDAFTQDRLRQEIANNPFPIIHLATHGVFTSSPRTTFILTWENRVSVNDFETLLKARETSTNRPIELLVLSACETAAGDKRAALGLAGMAVRSGARSTIATLWSVKDQSTARLMSEFYQVLSQGNISKAEALREAQLKLLRSEEFNHPFFWTPFVLVGNWS